MKALDRLAKIAPRWAKRIKKMGYEKAVEKSGIVDHKRLDIIKPRYCIVGEAHGFTNDYGNSCHRCNRFSCSLTWRGGSSIINSFCDHFEKVHGK